jgi:threonine dehydratase
VKVTVFAPKTIDESKAFGIRALGAELQLVDGTCFLAEQIARSTAQEKGIEYISPYNDFYIMAGNQ